LEKMLPATISVAASASTGVSDGYSEEERNVGRVLRVFSFGLDSNWL